MLGIFLLGILGGCGNDVEIAKLQEEQMQLERELKKAKAETERAETEKREVAEKLEAERVAKEKAETEKREVAEKLEREKRAKAKLEAERKAELERVAKERAEAEAKRKAEKERGEREIKFEKKGEILQKEAILKLDTGGHSAMINDILVTKSGDIISAGDDKTIRVWDSKTGKERRKILGEVGEGSEGKIFAIALSKDERYLAVGGYFEKDEIRIYFYPTGKLIKSPLCPTDQTYHIFKT